MRLAAIHLHPVKSTRTVPVTEVEVHPRGLRRDRRWMIVDADGRFVSQRDDPRLGRIAARLDGDRMTLVAPDAAPLTLPAEPSGDPDRHARVWGDDVPVVDAGDAAASWLAGVLGEGRRLVGMTDASHRPADPAYARAGDEVSFADGFPFLLANVASLDDLQRRAGMPLAMERFRPNLVVEGAAPFAEDGWSHVRIGAVRFRVVKPCVRCVVTTLDPESGHAGAEPLRTLATYRRTPEGGVTFGQNLLADGRGRIRVGDEVVAEPPTTPPRAR